MVGTKNPGVRAFEFGWYLFLSVTAVGLVHFLFLNLPVTYTRLIAEDQLGENATFCCYAFSGALLLVAAFKRASWSRRLMWFPIGIVALVIAGEEISWGQRLVHIPVPHFINRHNLQSELTIHNIAALRDAMSVLYLFVAYAIVFWVLLSAVLHSLRRPGVFDKLVAAGVPLIPVRLAPVFFITPYFFLRGPTSKSDEIGELFLAVAVLIWAVDVVLTHASSKPRRRLAVAGLVLGALLFTAAATGALSLLQESRTRLVGRLNVMAARDYPARGMVDQAETIFGYLEAHPESLELTTRINEGIVLYEAGLNDRAASVLADAAAGLESADPPQFKRGLQLRSLGIAYQLLGRKQEADRAFKDSLDVERDFLRQAPTPDRKALRLWSCAKTLAARGDNSAAQDEAQRAAHIATSTALREKLDEWVEELEADRLTRIALLN